MHLLFRALHIDFFRYDMYTQIKKTCFEVM